MDKITFELAEIFPGIPLMSLKDIERVVQSRAVVSVDLVLDVSLLAVISL